MRKEDCYGKIEDLKETAPCGMVIHYCVDKTTDFVTYSDINGRGKGKFTEKCSKCSWRGICSPTYPETPELLELREKVKVYEDAMAIYINRMSFIKDVINLAKVNTIPAIQGLQLIESTLIEKELFD